MHIIMHLYFTVLLGIGGEKCDECAVGFYQETHLTREPVHSRTISHDDSPRCRECGECFTNWNRILSDLSNKTKERVAKAENVKVTGVTGGFSRVFEDMEDKLGQVKDILRSASVSNDELLGVQREIDGIDAALKSTTDKLDDLDENLAETKQDIFQDRTNLDLLRTNVEGALNLTRIAKSKSDEAASNVREISFPGGSLYSSESRRKATETQIQNSGKTTKEKECDNLCGGAGCNQCGGLSCLSGAVTMAGTAVKSAEDADAILVEKDREAEQALRAATKADLKAQNAANVAQNAFDRANEAKNRSAGEWSGLRFADEIKDFTEGEKATPEDVKN
ncbi:Uncharacterized protein FKW44_021730 [Caligus rogercresseyi]|uniref:C2H2-type domain-containing protein n=1 Tax=Caligus rogercresseyi TaxID=217165 RepID=A0A7T8GRQ1_CALRO|nr:Uncharacterized protein FKW44_021730 [Caligus rogercresseyi]